MVCLRSLRLISTVLMSEGDDEEEFSDEDYTSARTPPVITFRDLGAKPEASASDRALKRAFMVCVFLKV